MRDELLRYAQVLISDDAMSCDLCLNSAAPDDFFIEEEVLEFIEKALYICYIPLEIVYILYSQAMSFRQPISKKYFPLFHQQLLIISI